jgi:hypothetical protein
MDCLLRWLGDLVIMVTMLGTAIAQSDKHFYLTKSRSQSSS